MIKMNFQIGNKKSWALVIFFVFSNICFSQDFLRVQGKEIVNNNGPFILRGIGTGNWLLQEGYMMQSTKAGLNTHTQFRNKLNETIGVEKTNEFYETWIANHFTKKDLDAMKSFGFNSVRVALHYKWFTPPIEDETKNSEGVLQNTWFEKGFQVIDDLLLWCEQNEMYLILDMHGAPGGQGKNASISDYDPIKPSLWESEDNKNKLIALWVKLAERYKNSEWIGGYDLINESNWSLDGSKHNNGCDCKNNDDLWDVHQRIIQGIRAVNKNHIVYISGNCWGNNYESFDENSLKNVDDNMVITFHKYWNNNRKDVLDKWLDMREKYNLPLWMSESGENSNTWFTDSIELYEENKIGWSWWPVKKSKYNNILKVETDQSYYDLMNAWEQGKSLPVQETYNAVMAYAESHKYENCLIAKDVIYAMIEQPTNFKTKPFKTHKVNENILFSDYDFGRNSYAYFDNQVANYHVDDGQERVTWNLGGFYRNDGVDIASNNGIPYVGWFDKGEWMCYTIDIPKEGNYKIEINSASKINGSSLKFEMNNAIISDSIELPNTNRDLNWSKTTLEGISLPKGKIEIKVSCIKAGSNLLDFTIIEK